MSYTKRALELYVYERHRCAPADLEFCKNFCFKDWDNAPSCDCPECAPGRKAEDSLPGAHATVRVAPEIVDLNLGDVVALESYTGFKISAYSAVGDTLMIYATGGRRKP